MSLLFSRLRSSALLFGGALACGAAPVPEAAPAPARPNVIVILADDIGYSDLGCYGGEIDTPNLDGLAADGVRFTQFYNTARCCPSRASLLTGLYPHQAGIGYMTDRAPYSARAMINEWYAGDLRHDVATLAEVARGGGYATYAVGKWHVTKHSREGEAQDNWPLQRGFDHYYGILPGAANYFSPAQVTQDNETVDLTKDPAYRAGDYYLTDAFSDHAVQFVHQHAQRSPEQPFFLYLAYTAAHWPLHAKPADVAKYRGRYDAGYDAIREQRYARMRDLGVIPSGTGLSAPEGDWSAVERPDYEARRMEVYAAQIDCMDQGIGRLVAELKASGQWENTLILYLQDNGGCAEEIHRRNDPKVDAEGRPIMPGPGDTWLSYGEAWAHVSNTPFRLYKHYTHEGGVATPLIAHWPAGIHRPGAIASQPAHLIDIMATLVDVGHLPYPTQRDGAAITPMEGRSLVPAFAGQPIGRDTLFWEHEGNRALRVGDWKLVAEGPGGAWELYDLTRDRSELHDLAAEYPDRVADMAAVWMEWAHRTHALPWPWKPKR